MSGLRARGAAGGYARAGTSGGAGFVTVTRRGKRWAQQVYEPGGAGEAPVAGTFANEARGGRRRARGEAGDRSVRPGKDGPGLMVWLRDYPRAAVSSRRTYELRHACATLLL